MKTKFILFAVVVFGALGVFVLLAEYQASVNSLPWTNSLAITPDGPSMEDYSKALHLIQQLNATLQQRPARKPAPTLPTDDLCHGLRNEKTQDIWMAHLPELLKWSIHPYDKERIFVDFQAQLLHLMSPERFERAIKTLPHRYWDSVKAAKEITRNRVEALKLNATNPPRKLHILVMGGSVAEGDKCNPRVKGIELQQRRRSCAWPFRLQFILDRILGEDVVEVTTATVGGTNSEAALVLLEYDLVPKEVDIVIHAYATNDMHAYTMESANAEKVTLRDRVFDLTEQFVRRVLSRCRPSQGPPPLLIYIDDYLGNEQNNILETAHIAQTVPWLANYYGFLHLSYADAVRDLVYANTQENFLSPYWKIMNASGVLYREVHPGMGAHVVTSFMILYSLLHTMTTYCSLPEHVDRRWDANGKLQYEPIGGLPELNKTFKLHRYYKAPDEPRGLPPQVYPNLTLDSVTNKWKSYNPKSCSKEYENRCIFAWVSRITPNCMIPEQLDTTIDKYSVLKNHGWQSELKYKKLGLVPTAGLSSKLTLEFTNLTQPVSSIMLMVMKSYGPKWSDSKVQMKALYRPRGNDDWHEHKLSLTEFTGYHKKNTSEQYSYTSELLDGPTTHDLRVSVQQVSGNTSKIMGMAVCSR